MPFIDIHTDMYVCMHVCMHVLDFYQAGEELGNILVVTLKDYFSDLSAWYTHIQSLTHVLELSHT